MHPNGVVETRANHKIEAVLLMTAWTNPPALYAITRNQNRTARRETMSFFGSSLARSMPAGWFMAVRKNYGNYANQIHEF